MLPPPARSSKRGRGLGEVLDSRGVSPAHWLSEPAGSLALHPGASFLVHMVRQTISKWVRQARHCSGNDQTKIFALLGAPILVWGLGSEHTNQRRK